MASYYYLISSLPMLKTQGEPPMDYAAFLAMCKSAVSSGVYQTLEDGRNYYASAWTMGGESYIWLLLELSLIHI